MNERKERSNKTISIILIAVIMVLLVAAIAYTLIKEFAPVRINSMDAETVLLELIDDENPIESVEVTNEKDKEAFKELLQGEAVSDNGFVFAAGSYRIVLKTPDREYALYPYCGVPNMFRVGKSPVYYELGYKKERQLLKLLSKYEGYGKPGIGSLKQKHNE